jgi:hypothetical protein
MLRQFLKETVIVLGGTLLFLTLCATVGISTSKPRISAAKAAWEPECVTDEMISDRYPIGRRGKRTGQIARSRAAKSETKSVTSQVQLDL